jgi:hypothetical protein
MKIQVLDPPMCCSTGVCGPSVDPELLRFAADIDWLKRQGVDVERNNLSQQPALLANKPIVMETLGKRQRVPWLLTVPVGSAALLATLGGGRSERS